MFFFHAKSSSFSNFLPKKAGQVPICPQLIRPAYAYIRSWMGELFLLFSLRYFSLTFQLFWGQVIVTNLNTKMCALVSYIYASMKRILQSGLANQNHHSPNIKTQCFTIPQMQLFLFFALSTPTQNRLYVGMENKNKMKIEGRTTRVVPIYTES